MATPITTNSNHRLNMHPRELVLPIGLIIGLFGTIWLGASSLGKQEEKISQLENRVDRWDMIIIQLNRIDRSQAIMDTQVKNLGVNLRKAEENIKTLINSIKGNPSKSNNDPQL